MTSWHVGFREAERSCGRSCGGSCGRNVGRGPEDESDVDFGRDDKPLHGLVLGRDCRVVIG